MSTIDIETDYLLVGAGATAMALADTLLSEQTDATLTIVDRQHRPGGHWNNAYPFCGCTSRRSGTAWPPAS